jgi:hypothetical protein
MPMRTDEFKQKILDVLGGSRGLNQGVLKQECAVIPNSAFRIPMCRMHKCREAQGCAGAAAFV